MLSCHFFPIYVLYILKDSVKTPTLLWPASPDHSGPLSLVLSVGTFFQSTFWGATYKTTFSSSELKAFVTGCLVLSFTLLMSSITNNFMDEHPESPTRL